EATQAQPYLGLRLRIDRGSLRSLIEEARLEPPVDVPGRGARVFRTGPTLLDAVLRLVRLLRRPGEISVLAPMIERELLFRLLLDETGPALHRLAREERRPEGIDAALGWLRVHFREAFRVDVLARRTGMSVSSFHHWFRAVTGMSPLQYQKQLRLEEARRILRNEGRDVGTVSRWVGYESSSQFSREYRRLFGNPPAREIRLLKLRAVGVGARSAAR
ncbi:MAG TPA: AraC family transcriptional regulator N-terminal domain-containing protein, partial [Myxococcaceae bacterium]|nr:AraC family transcriptional regulator N-terminal domain-containing protein [Myxococcaceae bacterium]